jgi:hypothetical protein
MFDLNKSRTFGYHLPMVISSNFKDGKNNTNSNALINEYKGNLFEYLVAISTSKQLGVEGAFLQSFGGEAKERLTFYQYELMELDKDLYKQLPVLAEEVSRLLYNKLKNKQITNVLVMGKSAGASHDESYGECDIMMTSNKSQYPYSLKFCKYGAYVNTKSGGIRSFFNKYFAEYGSIVNNYQEKLNGMLDVSFEQMARELYEASGLDYDADEKAFGPLWKGPTLPGQLEEKSHTHLLAHYYRIIKYMDQCFRELFECDESLFIKSLAPIVGLKDEKIEQIICFHDNNKKAQDIKFYSAKDHREAVKDIEFLDFKDNVSSFEIRLGKRLLQIRVKPMNIFTVSGLKVNCSMKYIK